MIKNILLGFFLFVFFWQALSVGLRAAAILGKVGARGVYVWQYLVISASLTYFVLYFLFWR